MSVPQSVTLSTTDVFKDSSGNPVANGILVLRIGDGVAPPKISFTGELTLNFIQFALNASGQLSGTPTIYGSDQLDGSVVYYWEVFYNNNFLAPLAAVGPATGQILLTTDTQPVSLLTHAAAGGDTGISTRGFYPNFSTLETSPVVPSIPTGVVAANLILAGPASGSPAVPGYRYVTNADLPVVDTSHGGTGVASVPSALFAAKPVIADGVQFVSAEGSDSNDGLSWGSAKASLTSAFLSISSRGGTVFVGAGFSETLTSTLVFPARTHVIFLGTGNIICNTGAADGIQLPAEGCSLDGFCLNEEGANDNGTVITRGSTTGILVNISRNDTTNAILQGCSLRNVTLDQQNSTSDAFRSTACWNLILERILVVNSHGICFHFLDDLNGSANNLSARHLDLRDLYCKMTGGTGPAIQFDSINGLGISEVRGYNIHVDEGDQAGWLFNATGNRQNSQMTFNNSEIFNNTLGKYAIQFVSPAGSNFSTNTGALVTDIHFNQVDIENQTSSPGTQTVPAIGATVGGVASGAACAGLVFFGGAYGYQGSSWPDGFDYAHLGTASFFYGTTGQFNVIGRALTVNGQIALQGSTPTVASGYVGLGTTTATSATAGSNGDVPAQVVGYLEINIGGTNFKIPYYAV